MNFWRDLNIKRFVLARENSLNEIKLIKESTNKELEVFVHGALCVAYSGQCFTSDSIGGRSANRGQCAQSCRFGYDLIVDDKLINVNVDKKFLLSPKDLCGINDIKSLMDINIDAFKVEGRLKSPEYVAITAQEYRKTIDTNKIPNPFNMESIYSRGFYSGWFHGVNHQKLVDGSYSSHRGVLIGTIVEVGSDNLIVNTKFNLKAGDGLLWVYVSQNRVLESGGLIYECNHINENNYRLKFDNRIKISKDLINAKIYLNKNNELEKNLQKTYTDKNQFKKIPIKIEVEIELGQPLIARISDGKYTHTSETISKIALANNKAVSDDFILNEFSSLGGTVFFLNEFYVKRNNNSDVFINHKELKLLRRDLTKKLTQTRSQNTIDQFKSEVIVNVSSAQTLFESKSSKLPKLNILLREKKQVDDFVDFYKSLEEVKVNINSVILDFEFGRDYLPSIKKLKEHTIKCGIATLRILKPTELKSLKIIETINPDLVLIRNLGALNYFTKISKYKGELIGDFSLNISNHKTSNYLFNKGLSTQCVSYDLNYNQVCELIKNCDAQKMEVTVHQYMPSFHMEHCVFASNLSSGSSFKDCGFPCEKHKLELKDQFGNYHFIKADQECRNTMYNSIAYSAARFIPELSKLNLGFIRYEALNETGIDLISKIQGYLNLLLKKEDPESVIKNLNLLEKYGLGEGTLRKDKEYQSRKQ
ncbi:MAG: U32 family peptidase [Bacteriovoracaceae bacterium]